MRSSAALQPPCCPALRSAWAATVRLIRRNRRALSRGSMAANSGAATGACVRCVPATRVLHVPASTCRYRLKHMCLHRCAMPTASGWERSSPDWPCMQVREGPHTLPCSACHALQAIHGWRPCRPAHGWASPHRCVPVVSSTCPGAGPELRCLHRMPPTLYSPPQHASSFSVPHLAQDSEQQASSCLPECLLTRSLVLWLCFHSCLCRAAQPAQDSLLPAVARWLHAALGLEQVRWACWACWAVLQAVPPCACCA